MFDCSHSCRYFSCSHKASAVENLKIVEKALEGKPKGIVNNQFTVADIPLYQVSFCWI